MQLDWTAPALADLRCIGRFLKAEARPEIATRMLTLIRDRSMLLKSFPQAGPAVAEPGIRSLRVHHTPYILLYRTKDGAMQILRVHHEREDWRSRELPDA